MKEDEMGFICPECGREFVKPNGLGAHRFRVHGVAGTSRTAPAVEMVAVESALDRDLLLTAVFAGGRIPPRVEVLDEVGGWLDAAERLAKVGRG